MQSEKAYHTLRVQHSEAERRAAARKAARRAKQEQKAYAARVSRAAEEGEEERRLRASIRRQRMFQKTLRAREAQDDALHRYEEEARDGNALEYELDVDGLSQLRHTSAKLGRVQEKRRMMALEAAGAAEIEKLAKIRKRQDRRADVFARREEALQAKRSRNIRYQEAKRANWEANMARVARSEEKKKAALAAKVKRKESRIRSERTARAIVAEERKARAKARDIEIARVRKMQDKIRKAEMERILDSIPTNKERRGIRYA